MSELAIGQRVRSLRLGDETIEGAVVSGVQGHDDMVIVAWDMPRESYEARSDLVAAAARPTPDAEAMERFVESLTVAIGTAMAVGAMTVEPTDKKRVKQAKDELRQREQAVLDLYRKAVSR